MANMEAKLNFMGMQMSKSFFVQIILNSLRAEFVHFQVNYNTLKEKWNFQEIVCKLPSPPDFRATPSLIFL